MWELDHKESWTPKNGCFQAVELEKTLESPLDCKDIKPVNPQGNQSWIFVGRTDSEAETPVLWPRDAKSWFNGEDPDAQHQSFPMSQFFTSVGQSFGASASALVFPMNIQDWFPLRLTGLISLHSKGLSRVFSNTKSINFSVLSFLYGPTLRSIHDYRKNHSFD